MLSVVCCVYTKSEKYIPSCLYKLYNMRIKSGMVCSNLGETRLSRFRALETPPQHRLSWTIVIKKLQKESKLSGQYSSATFFWSM